MAKLVSLYIIFLKVTECIYDVKWGLTVYLTSYQSKILISLSICCAIISLTLNQFIQNRTLANLSKKRFVETISQSIHGNSRGTENQIEPDWDVIQTGIMYLGMIQSGLLLLPVAHHRTLWKLHMLLPANLPGIQNAGPGVPPCSLLPLTLALLLIDEVPSPSKKESGKYRSSGLSIQESQCGKQQTIKIWSERYWALRTTDSQYGYYSNYSSSRKGHEIATA